MGATNHTTNYELSQFIGTDKPSWLNDYNNDMLKIDTAVKANATAASGAQSTASTADGKADANALAIQTLDSQINTPSTGLAAVVAGHTTDISSINGVIGNTPLTTVAQTLTGAIEEVKGSIPSIASTLVDGGIKYVTVAADGVKSYQALLNDLYASFRAYISAKSSAFRFSFMAVQIAGLNTFPSLKPGLYSNNFDDSISFMTFGISGTAVHEYLTTVEAANSAVVDMLISDTPSVTNSSLTVPTTGLNLTLYFNEFNVNA